MHPYSEVKRQAKGQIRSPYWRNVFLALLSSLTTAVAFGAVLIRISGGEQSGFNNWGYVLKIVRFYQPDFLTGTDTTSQVLSYVLGILFNLATPFLTFPLYTASLFYGTDFTSRTQILYLVLSLLTYLSLLIFLLAPLHIGTRFYFHRREKGQARTNTLLYSFRSGFYLNIVRVELLKSVLLVLSAMLIFPFPVVYFGLLFVDDILCENPTLPAGKVLRLSFKLAKGRKRSLFLYRLSFLGWDALSLLTGDLFGLLFTRPYLEISQTKIFDRILREASVLGAGIQKDLQTLDEEEKKSWLMQKAGDFGQSYSVVDLFLMFFAVSMIGWVWEVLLHLIQTQTFVNRGTLYGPWLPIYGAGGVTVLVLLKRLRKWPWLTFLISIVVCLAIEYATGALLWKYKGIRYWDYSDMPLNLNGFICLYGGLAFGGGCVAMVYFVAPALEVLFRKIPAKVKWVLVAFLLAAFLVDVGFSLAFPRSGPGITA